MKKNKHSFAISPANSGAKKNRLKLISIAITALLFLWALPSFAQSRTVKGLVKDDKNNLLPRVSIQVVGTNTVSLTDEQGAFSILVPSPNSVLLFSFVGMSNTEVALNARTELLVTLLPLNIADIQDVVVVGYGTQKKVTVTGAVAQVTGTELSKSSSVNLSNALVGRLPGITAINSNGEPGGGASLIRIRGTSTLGNSSALVVVDGVPDRAGGLDRLNAADIESFSVLKDAAAAIYGARAANGVILITTKRGKSGKPILSYNADFGWSQPTVIPKLMDAVEYATVNNELIMFNQVPSGQWGTAWDALKTTGTYTRTDNGAVVTAAYHPDVIKKHADGSDKWKYPNTDWFADALKTWAPQQQHNLQVSGGSETVKYMASIGFLDQDGIYKKSANGYKQYDLRANLDIKVNKYITTAVGFSVREENRSYPIIDASSIFRMLMRGKPTEPEFWPNGLPGPDIEGGQNPAVITTNLSGYTRNKIDYLQTTGKIEIKIPWVEGLKLTGSAAIDKSYENNKKWETPWSLYFWNKTTYEADGKTPKLTKAIRSPFADPRLTLYNANQLNILLSSMLNYDKKFGDHTFNFLAAITKETISNENFGAFKRYFISAAIDQLNVGGAAGTTAAGTGAEKARLSYFGRAQYNYKEKYLAEFLWRYDGSYIFPEDKRFGFFPGILAGWNISKENFFDRVKFINSLKLRGSYGQLGNDQIFFNGALQEYAFLPLYGFSSYVLNGTQIKTLFETRKENSDFTWEVANNANIGFEGSALGNKLNFEFDYFRNKRTQIFWPKEGLVPGTAGLILPPVNFAKVISRGWEFKVGYSYTVNKDARINFGLNGGYSTNKVLDFAENKSLKPWQRATGNGFGSNGVNYLVYEYDGVFKDQAEIDKNTIDYSQATGKLKPGDMKFKDINKDGKIDGDDRTRLKKNRDPRFTYGFNVSVSFKNFDFSALFQGATGGLLFIGTESGDIGNYLDYSWENRWTVDNPSSTHPRLANRGDTYYASNVFGSNTYWLKSSNYLRCKNMEIAYTIPPSLLKIAGISNVRVYVAGQNLITWDKLKIYDPEATRGDGKYYPQSRIVNAGFKITL